MKNKLMALVVLFSLIFVYSVIAEPLDFEDYINEDNYKIGLTKIQDLELVAGFGYSLMDGRWKGIFTKRIAEYKRITVELGHDIDNMLLGGLSYHWFRFDEVGILKKIPIVNWLEFNTGLMGGWRRLAVFEGTGGNNEWDLLPTISLIKKKF